VDYSEQYLKNYIPVSFHRHWMIDPYHVYAHWLKDADTKTETHDEL
jgi:UDP-glucose:O-linked fucose beta-1,3-glucosyltransferase